MNQVGRYRAASARAAKNVICVNFKRFGYVQWTPLSILGSVSRQRG